MIIGGEQGCYLLTTEMAAAYLLFSEHTRRRLSSKVL